jgi:two-component system sensor histidine kinase UhpB
MRRSTLLTQVLAVNALLVGVTALIAAVVARDRLPDATSGDGLLVLGLTVTSAILLNSLLLRARLEPMDRLVRAMTAVDLARPGMRATTPRRAARELHDLTDAFNRMLTRLEDERRESGRAVLRAQEQERSRIAQDLHDEVNQALTAILLRLQALSEDAPPELNEDIAELKTLVNQAMEELLRLARQLRPASLDDMGLIAAIQSQISRFAATTAIQASFHHEGTPDALTEDQQTVIYRVVQEALSNTAQHSDATFVDFDLRVFPSHGVELRIRDNGRGFDATMSAHDVNGIGLSGMAERARLVGGELTVTSSPGSGTRVRLYIPQ